MKRVILVVAVSLAISGLSMADPITGSVTITSGFGFMGENGAGFNIGGPNFSASDTTDFDYRYGDTHLPTNTANLSCAAGNNGTYEGVTAACFGPFGLTPFSSYPAAYNAGEGIDFTFGLPTTLENGDEVGNFTATGELIGFTPAGCAGGPPFDCTELWDVTLTGQGTYTLIPNNSRTDFVAVDLQFEPPASTPEPSTGLLMWGGILLGAGAMARNKSGAWLRNLLS